MCFVSNCYKCFKEISTTNASQLDLITIGRNIKNKFNNIFSNEEKIDYVLIENQISPIANRMKTIQGMIAQYFIMNDSEHIEFVSSINGRYIFIKYIKIEYNNNAKPIY